MSKCINLKAIGGILLVVGTIIGGGMLALPTSNAAAGFTLSSIYLCMIWAVSTFSAFLTLEINLGLPAGNNMVSMAKSTLGYFGQTVAWIAYCFLLLCLLSAYISGGSDLLQNMVGLLGVHLSEWFAAVLFVCLLGVVVIRGIRSVDQVNRVLMFGKLGIFFLIIVLLFPHVKFPLLFNIHSEWALASLMVTVTSFGFSIIVPSLRSYFNDDIPMLRRVMLIGSIIPLICYILWNMSVMGVVPQQGPNGLIHMAQSGHETTALIEGLRIQLNNAALTSIIRVFTSICMLTAFLAVSMSLSDFFADGLNLKKSGQQGLIIYFLTFVPALAIVLIYPGIFIKSLAYGGIFCTVLLILMPIMMTWSSRYWLNTPTSYRVCGGKPALMSAFILALALTFIGLVCN